MLHPVHSTFRPDVPGVFIDRPHRFSARVLVEDQVVEAHCPNPGRLTELLFPGVPVLLERAAGNRKTAFTLVALEHPGLDNSVVPLVSVRANPAVGALLLPRWFPKARMVQPEFRLGSSRFDWYVEDDLGARHLIEVKACSEVEYGTALFPDAPSLRAVKHLEELTHWGTQGYQPHVVFTVVHSRPRLWAPNGHTDPLFTRTLRTLSPRLNLHAVVFQTDAQGNTGLVDADLVMDLSWDWGPDAGLLVQWQQERVNWRVTITWHPEGWERAMKQAPARRSFSIRCATDRSEVLAAELEAAGGTPTAARTLELVNEPGNNRAFVDCIMRWRHTPPVPY